MNEHTAEGVALYDHFDGWTEITLGQPQPQYGLVQINVTRKGQFISLDIKKDALLAAIEQTNPPGATS